MMTDLKMAQVQTILIVILSCALVTKGFGPDSRPTISKSKSISSLLNADEVAQTIRSGRVYQKKNFISEEQIKFLLKDISDLDESGGFERSGLSNTGKGSEQNFGQADRAVCPVPWWKSLLEGDKICEFNPVGRDLVELRLFLSKALDRPSMADPSLAHECYYSVSSKGSSLARHMDERHEELKGAKGWLLPSRRSVSWLIYMSDEDWSIEENGGALRSFPQTNLHKIHEPTHDGNIQIGWLRDELGSSPVYLDSWLSISGITNDGEYHQALYTIDVSDKKRILTRPWLPELVQGISLQEFIATLSKKDATMPELTLFLNKSDARRFFLLEDRSAWDEGNLPAGSYQTDTCPYRGSLVVFDSVLLPHQVEKVTQGKRIALAGWFHEKTQSIPGFDMV